MRAGELDLGVVGEAPPLFAQAAHAPFVYLAAEPPAPEAEAIVVPAGSPVRRVADLRGRRVALTRGRERPLSAHARARGGGRGGRRGRRDVLRAGGGAPRSKRRGRAWAIWDPLLASVQHATGARVLRDARGLASNRAFYVGSRRFAQGSPGSGRAFLGRDRGSSGGPRTTTRRRWSICWATRSASRAGAAHALRRNRFGLRPFDAELTRSQQRVADLSLRAKLIPHPISVADARWMRAPQGVALSCRP